MHDVVRAGCLLAGRYRLDTPIGRGAMGIVWRGRDELLERDIAVKEVRVPTIITPDQADVIYQRTLREAKTAARLNHPGVATVYDVIEEDGSPWLVMELVRARALDQVVTEDGPLRPLAAARLGERLLSALTCAHAVGVLHRDVKPSNVLLGQDGRAVLTDFGIATFDGDPGLTQAGMVVGTPGFTAPERMRGRPATPAADLWSLGATLYAAVEGRGPFDRAGGPAAIMAGVVNEGAPRAPSAGPLMPVIDALLRADPSGRPDAAAAARMLAEAAAGASAGEALPGYPWPDPGAADEVCGGRDATTAACPIPPGPLTPDGIPAFVAAAAPPDADVPPGPAGFPDLAGGLGGEDPPGSAGLPAFLDMPAFPGEPALPGLLLPLPGAQPSSPRSARPAPASRHPARPRPPMPGGRQGFRQGRTPAMALAAVAVLAAGLLGGLAYARSAGRQDAAQGATGLRQQTSSQDAGQARDQGAGATSPAGTTSPAGAAPGTAGTGTAGTGTAGTGTGGAGPAVAASPGPAARKPPAGPAPAGYHWYTVSAASSGATAGFTIAVPDGWQVSRQGLLTYLASPPGGMRAEINLTPFAFASPVREARLQRREALRRGQYPGYAGIIVPGTFDGAADALWRFGYRQAAGRVVVLDLLVRLATSAGEQSYALSMSAPRSEAAAAAEVFQQLRQTFRPAP